MSAQMPGPLDSDPTVISWDICERELTDGSKVFDVVGTSDECRVTLNCCDERTAEQLLDLLDSNNIVGAIAETLRNGAPPAEKTCTRCRDAWPADEEFFRSQPRPRQPHRLAPWCRACERDYSKRARSIASAAIAMATGGAS